MVTTQPESWLQSQVTVVPQVAVNLLDGLFVAEYEERPSGPEGRGQYIKLTTNNESISFHAGRLSQVTRALQELQFCIEIAESGKVEGVSQILELLSK